MSDEPELPPSDDTGAERDGERDDREAVSAEFTRWWGPIMALVLLGATVLLIALLLA